MDLICLGAVLLFFAMSVGLVRRLGQIGDLPDG
jgi:hypothetical protein